MIGHCVQYIRDVLWGLPFLGFITVVACTITVALGFVQFRHFFTSIRYVFADDKNSGAGDMSPLQAFLNTLSVSIGNGSLAGVATAMSVGGPGAAFWIFVAGLMGMALRFAEVFLAVSFAAKQHPTKKHHVLGGPFLYIDALPYGHVLAYTYAFACLLFSLIGGGAMQSNSIATALYQSAGVPFLLTTPLFVLFALYVMLGGAKRIVAIADFIIPIKVGLFFVSMIIILVYYYASLWSGLVLIFNSAFQVKAVLGASVGLSFQRMIAAGISRSINASESGLGTAAIFYGNTGSSHPLKDGISSMLSAFISNNVACFSVAIVLVITGVLGLPTDGSGLVVEAYKTVFGVAGGYIVSLLSVFFGLGVFVSYGYIARQCWFYLTNQRFEKIFIVLFVGASSVGALLSVQSVWALLDIPLAICLGINLVALLYLIPYMRRAIRTQKVV